MIKCIKKWFKGCEHRWIVYIDYIPAQDPIRSGYDAIFKECQKCGKCYQIKNNYLSLLDLRKYLKAIKSQNPDYYVIGIDE